MSVHAAMAGDRVGTTRGKCDRVRAAGAFPACGAAPDGRHGRDAQWEADVGRDSVSVKTNAQKVLATPREEVYARVWVREFDQRSSGGGSPSHRFRSRMRIERYAQCRRCLVGVPQSLDSASPATPLSSSANHRFPSLKRPGGGVQLPRLNSVSQSRPSPFEYSDRGAAKVPLLSEACRFVLFESLPSSPIDPTTSQQ